MMTQERAALVALVEQWRERAAQRERDGYADMGTVHDMCADDLEAALAQPGAGERAAIGPTDPRRHILGVFEQAALSALPSGGAEGPTIEDVAGCVDFGPLVDGRVAEGPTREQVEALVHDAYTNGLALPETVGPRGTRMADAYCRDVLALYAEPATEPTR